jgi:hypothetical protein
LNLSRRGRLAWGLAGAAAALLAASALLNHRAIRCDYWRSRLERLGERRSAEKLASLGEPGELALIEVLGSARSPDARASAAEALAGRDPTEAIVAALTRASTTDRDESVRRSASGAIATLDLPAADPTRAPEGSDR